MSKFKFELKAKVTVSISGEQGHVSSRMDSINGKNQYYVHYKGADGRATDSWFFENEIKPTPVAVKKTPVKKRVVKKRVVKKASIPSI